MTRRKVFHMNKHSGKKFSVTCEIYGELGCSHWADDKCDCDCHKISGHTNFHPTCINCGVKYPKYQTKAKLKQKCECNIHKRKHHLCNWKQCGCRWFIH